MLNNIVLKAKILSRDKEVYFIPLKELYSLDYRKSKSNNIHFIYSKKSELKGEIGIFIGIV